MDFQTAVRTVFLQKYATFHGRASRSEYWWWMLAILIGNAAAAFIDVAILGYDIETVAGQGEVSVEHDGPVMTVFYLATLIPNIAVAVRRLHDVGKSGWWFLIILFPLLGALYLVFLFVQRGNEGYNQYGPDPLDPFAVPEEGNAPDEEAPPAPSAPNPWEPTASQDDVTAAPIEPEPEPRADDPPARPSWRPPSSKKGFQTTQDRFKKK